MNKLFISPLIIIFLWFATGCKQREKENSLSFVTIDVTQKYPEKHINLEELADIELIRLEFDEDYLFKYSPTRITDNYILFFNPSNSECKIFTRQGKPFAQFNNQGNGPEEHKDVREVLLDEKENSLYMFSSDKVWVYSLTGAFKDYQSLPDSISLQSAQLFNEDLFICSTEDKHVPFSFFLLSKKDFSIQAEITIPFTERVPLRGTSKDGKMTVVMHAVKMARHPDGFIVSEQANDTVFLYNKNSELIPVLARTPSIRTTDPIIYIESMIDIKDYYFMESMELTIDPEKFLFGTKTRYMVEKETQHIFHPKIEWKEYKDYLVTLPLYMIQTTNNPKLGYLFLNLDSLLDAYDENKLSGQLKEWVEELDEDDNNVLVLLHFK